jgi:cytochrome c-type biogenesis protein
MTSSLIGASFVAGMFTFLAPCTFPLIPAYIGFITGDGKLNKFQTIRNGVLFVLGFMGIFVTLGVFATSLASILTADIRTFISQIAGIIIIIWGLEMIGLFQISLFQKSWTPRVKLLRAGTAQSSILLGILLGVGWSPCIGPILGTILTFLVNEGTILEGAFLMFIFSVGLAVPFLLTALSLAQGRELLQKIEHITPIIRIVSGIFLVLIGILFVTNNLEIMGKYLFSGLNFLNYDKILDYL